MSMNRSRLNTSLRPLQKFVLLGACVYAFFTASFTTDIYAICVQVSPNNNGGDSARRNPLLWNVCAVTGFRKISCWNEPRLCSQGSILDPTLISLCVNNIEGWTAASRMRIDQIGFGPDGDGYENLERSRFIFETGLQTRLRNWDARRLVTSLERKSQSHVTLKIVVLQIIG